MKKLLLLILFVLNLLLLQAQEVKFISVNGADTSLQNISFKRLSKLLQKDTLTADTLTTSAKWMLKLNKKLSKKQRQDSNIYIFFCPTSQDSATAFLPLSGKYGYVIFDSSKVGVVELERMQLRLSTWKYQWDLIHDPQTMLFAFMQDEEEGQSIGYFSAVKTLKACHSEKLDELLLKDKQVFYFYSPSDPEEGKIYKIAIDDYTKFNIYVYEYSDNYYSIRPGSIAAIERDGVRSNAYFKVGSLDIDEFDFQGYRHKKEDGTYENYNIELVPASGSKYGMLIPYVKVTDEGKTYKLITLDSEHVKEEDISTALADCDCWDQKGSGNGTDGISQTIEETEGNSTLNSDEVKSLLSGLPTQAGTSFEFVQKGKVYYLDEDGKVKERATPLSKENLNNGNWTDSDNLKIRLGYDDKGNLQVNALGIKKSIIKKGKEDTKIDVVAANLKDDFNKILSENNIKGNVTPNSVGVNLSGDNSNQFPGGGDVQIDGNKAFFTILADAGNITVDFLKTEEIQKDVYLKGSSATIKVPGIATGTVESAAMMVTDMTSMVCMVSDLAFDKTARNEAKQGFVALKNQVVDNPNMLFPLLGEVILEEVTGGGTDEYKEAFADGTDIGRKNHLKSKMAVRTTTSILASGNFLVKLPKMMDDVVVKMSKADFRLALKKIDADNFKKLDDKLKALADDILVNKFYDDFAEATSDDLKKLLDNPDFVDNWKKLDGLGEDVIPTSLRKNPDFINKFDNVAKNNNLDLDSEGLSNLLKSPSTKLDAATGQPLKWDNPDGVLDGVKRASDANIEGLTVTHKKFPAPADGTDNFVLKNAKQYQGEASLDAGLSFEKGGVSFDNVAADGKLVDRKYGHGKSVFDEDGGVINENRASSILKQAQRQLDAVDGDASKLRWEISTPEGAAGIEELFLNNNIDIEVKHVKQLLIK